jgi:hypothetical protein
MICFVDCIVLYNYNNEYLIFLGVCCCGGHFFFLVYCERRNTRETEVAGVRIEPLTKGKIKWGRVPTLPAVLLVVAN